MNDQTEDFYILNPNPACQTDDHSCAIVDDRDRNHKPQQGQTLSDDRFNHGPASNKHVRQKAIPNSSRIQKTSSLPAKASVPAPMERWL